MHNFFVAMHNNGCYMSLRNNRELKNTEFPELDRSRKRS